MLILDEPTAGLDPKGRDRILGQIQEYQQDQKNTVLIVSHSMEDVAKFAKKVLVMNQARVFMYDDTEKVFAHASEIEQMGLAVPQVTRVFMRLAEMGYPVNPHTYTIKAAKEQILDLFDQEKGGPQKCLEILPLVSISRAIPSSAKMDHAEIIAAVCCIH